MFYDPMENQFPDPIPPQFSNLYEYTVEYYDQDTDRKLAEFLGHVMVWTSRVWAIDEHNARRWALESMHNAGFCVTKFLSVEEVKV